MLEIQHYAFCTAAAYCCYCDRLLFFLWYCSGLPRLLASLHGNMILTVLTSKSNLERQRLLRRVFYTNCAQLIYSYECSMFTRYCFTSYLMIFIHLKKQKIYPIVQHKGRNNRNVCLSRHVLILLICLNFTTVLA